MILLHFLTAYSLTVWYDSFPLETEEAVKKYFIAVVWNETAKNKYKYFCDTYAESFPKKTDTTHDDKKGKDLLNYLNLNFIDFAIHNLKNYSNSEVRFDRDVIFKAVDEKTKDLYGSISSLKSYCKKIKEDPGYFFFHMGIIMQILLEDNTLYSQIKNTVESYNKLRIHQYDEHINQTIRKINKQCIKNLRNRNTEPMYNPKHTLSCPILEIGSNTNIFSGPTMENLISRNEGETIVLFQHINVLNLYVNTLVNAAKSVKSKGNIDTFSRQIYETVDEIMIPSVKRLIAHAEINNKSPYFFNYNIITEDDTFLHILDNYLNYFIENKDLRNEYKRIFKKTYLTFFK